MNNFLLSSLLIISSIILIKIAFYGIRKRKVHGAFFFSILIMAMTVHSVGYAFELLSNTVEQMYFWIKIEYIGVSFYPILIMLFASEYSDEKKFANKYILNLLLMLNIVTLVLVYTNNDHFLYYSSLGVDSSQGFNVLAIGKGDWYFVQEILLLFSIFYSIINFTIKLKKSKGNYRKRIISMLIGVTIPLIIYIIYMLELGPKYIDLMPFSNLFMVLLITAGIFRYDTFFFIPITHEMVINSIDEGVIVVDKERLMLSFNYASKLFFPSLNNLKIGESISRVSELNGFDFGLDKAIYEIDDKVLNFKIIDMENGRGSIYVVSDITKSERIKKELEIFAREDALTGLYNRRYFMENFNKIQNDGVFIIIDIDYFKNINDTFGHTEGDKVLRSFAEKLKLFFSEQMVCRYGGEEFALFIQNISVEQGVKEIEVFRKIIDAEEGKLKFTCSAGVAKYTKGQGVEAIIKADNLLYEAKESGRNQTKF